MGAGGQNAGRRRLPTAGQRNAIVGFGAFLEVTLTRLGRLDDAVRTLDEGLGHCPGSGTLLMRRGVFLTRLDRNDEAMRAFDEAIRVDPEYPETWAFGSSAESVG